MTMISTRRAITLTIFAAAAPVLLLLDSTPAAAKRGGAGRMVEVGPIWNQQDAEMKCAKAARREGGTWTGQWKTTRPGQMSVCEIRTASARGGRAIEVGPIWNQQDAEMKCPKAARKAGGRWTGQWWTTRPGQMSVCEVKMDSAGKLIWPDSPKKPGGFIPGRTDQRGKRMVEVGPIWNQMDAERKCAKAARDSGGKWTGQWKTTRPGQMSVCEIAK